MSRIRIDLAGKQFGRLTAIEDVGSKRSRRLWRCICSCGKETVVDSWSLKSGLTMSCGCLVKERLDEARTKHGYCGTRLYRIWKGMIARCKCPSSTDYKWYGARGICVCAEWNDFRPFMKWALENGYEETLTIDRIDNSGNYTPTNCRWATIAQQNANKRRRA